MKIEAQHTTEPEFRLHVRHSPGRDGIQVFLFKYDLESRRQWNLQPDHSWKECPKTGDLVEVEPVLEILGPDLRRVLGADVKPDAVGEFIGQLDAVRRWHATRFSL